MDEKPDKLPQSSNKTTLQAIGSCWVLIAWLNTSYEENLFVYILLTGLLIAIALAGTAVILEQNRRKRMQRS